MSWYQQTNAQHVDPWSSISTSSDGKYLYAVTNTTLYFTSDWITWSEPSSNGSNAWISVATTTTTTPNEIGRYVIASASGALPYISDNFGDTMTLTSNTDSILNTSGNYQVVATSYDGSSGQFVACDNSGSSGNVYTSVDGNTWVSQSGPGSDNWSSVSISNTSSSTIVVVSNVGVAGSMWVGTLSGTYSWTNLNNMIPWDSVSISQAGTTIVGASAGGTLYISKLSVAGWSIPTEIVINSGSLPNSTWNSLSISSDGYKILVTKGSESNSGVYILTSSDNGVNYSSDLATIATGFTTADGTFGTMSATAQARGFKMAVGDAQTGGYIYTSTNSGVSCFVKGTIISIKENGIEKEIEIENINRKHLIKITNGSFMRIKSLMYNYVSWENSKVIFRKIPKDLFGENLPNKDLYISKGHGILFNDGDFDKYKNSKYTNYKVDIDNLKKLRVDHVLGNQRIFDVDVRKIASNHPNYSLDDSSKCNDSNVYFFHIILDDEDPDSKHGIYANGIVCESFRLNDLQHHNLNEWEDFRN